MKKRNCVVMHWAIGFAVALVLGCGGSARKPNAEPKPLATDGAEATGSDKGQQPSNQSQAPETATREKGSTTTDRNQIAKHEGLSLEQFDLNRDGRPDVFKFFKEIEDPRGNGRKAQEMVRKELDINHDGKIDIVRQYEGGEVQQVRTDLDFDGRVDEVAFYAKGVVQRKEIDMNYDGKPDVTKFYVKGALERIESDRNLNGRVDTWEYFENGKLDRVGYDRNGDGKVDTWQRQRPPADEEAGASETEDAG